MLFAQNLICSENCNVCDSKAASVQSALFLACTIIVSGLFSKKRIEQLSNGNH